MHVEVKVSRVLLVRSKVVSPSVVVNRSTWHSNKLILGFVLYSKGGDNFGDQSSILWRLRCDQRNLFQLFIWLLSLTPNVFIFLCCFERIKLDKKRPGLAQNLNNNSSSLLCHKLRKKIFWQLGKAILRLRMFSNAFITDLHTCLDLSH